MKKVIIQIIAFDFVFKGILFFFMLLFAFTSFAIYKDNQAAALKAAQKPDLGSQTFYCSSPPVQGKGQDKAGNQNWSCDFVK
jgi:hypothetical protein